VDGWLRQRNVSGKLGLIHELAKPQTSSSHEAPEVRKAEIEESTRRSRSR
jgi:hypothetical protein